MLDPEKVTVKVGNSLKGQPKEVKATVKGLAALSEGLIAVGTEEIITEGNDMRSFSGLLELMNSRFADQDTIDKLNERYGDDLDDHYEAAKRGIGSCAFSQYIWELGALDTEYRLTAKGKDENELTLTIIGFD